MKQVTSGLHHITAIASDPQRNVDFYAGTLGLRLVKITVNYDDPGSYHFYYGDASGTPGSIITFFAWPGGRRGRRGAAQATMASFAIPEGSLSYWQRRLSDHGVSLRSAEKYGSGAENAVAFEDPDGLLLRVVEDIRAEPGSGWTGTDIPAEAAIRAFHSVTLTVADLRPTEEALIGGLGFELVEKDGSRAQYATPGSGRAHLVDVVQSSELYGSIGVGNIHHVAWRAQDAGEQLAWMHSLRDQGYGVSPVMDRQYFESIYYREPGGILFEIATDPPGFTTDESVEELGSKLQLPEWLEPRRTEIERVLLPLHLPTAKIRSAVR